MGVRVGAQEVQLARKQTHLCEQARGLNPHPQRRATGKTGVQGETGWVQVMGTWSRGEPGLPFPSVGRGLLCPPGDSGLSVPRPSSAQQGFLKERPPAPPPLSVQGARGPVQNSFTFRLLTASGGSCTEPGSLGLSSLLPWFFLIGATPWAPSSFPQTPQLTLGP